MARFCGKCGRKLNKKGACPLCSRQNKGKKDRKKTSAVWLWILTGVVLAGMGVGIYLACSAPEKNEEKNSSVEKEEVDILVVEFIDTDVYYSENSEVIDSFDAKEAEEITTVEETYGLLADRGFESIYIEPVYDMDGNFLDGQEVEQESEEEHPIYSAFYTTQAGEIWVITVINGSVTAMPVIYNQESENEVETIIAEEDTVMAYDGPLNKFYEIVPYESIAIIKRVEKIDAQTLENLTKEEIDKL